MIVWLVVGVQGSVERKKNQLWFGVGSPVDYELCYRLPAGFSPVIAVQNSLSEKVDASIDMVAQSFFYWLVALTRPTNRNMCRFT